jgi:hypothetical protein
MRVTMKERRRERRVTLRKPVPAAVDAAPVFVLDVSSGGLRVAHHSQLPPAGSVCRVDLNGDEASSLDCAIVHTVMQRATTTGEGLFQSGLRIVKPGPAAIERLQRVIKNDKKR